MSNFASAIVGAIVGGVIAARATRSATEQAHEHNLDVQRRTQQENINGVIKGIQAEIEILWETYLKEFGEELEALGENEPFLFYYPLHQSYFTIFDSNSSLIGHIQDDELRKAIIRTYITAKGLIDTHLYNNRLIEKYEETIKRSDEIPINEVVTSWSFQGHTSKELKELKEYATGIKANYIDAKQSVENLLGKLQKYNARNEGS